MKEITTLLMLIGICLTLKAQEAETETIPKKKYFTQSIEGKTIPKIDGMLDDPIWENVQWSGDYIQRQPYENQPPTQETKFKILYDAKNLYIAARCYDNEPDKIVKRMSRRDGFEGDWVEFNIDSYQDKRTAFSFTISVSGVKGDEFISNNVIAKPGGGCMESIGGTSFSAPVVSGVVGTFVVSFKMQRQPCME